MLNEEDIDFRISGLPHSVVKQAENSRVRELVKKIENHSLIDKLFKTIYNKIVYKPFTEKSKKMIEGMSNVELFQLFETDLKTQCKEYLLYWSQGIDFCSCGHLLKESEASRGAIQNYVTKRGRPHGHRYGKTNEQRNYHIAHNLRKMHQEAL